MAKYNDLLKEYNKEINTIKNMQKELKLLEDKLNELESQKLILPPSTGNEETDYANWTLAEQKRHTEILPLYEKQSDLHISITADLSKLTHDIEMAYWDVPFAKPRQQGINKFFKLSGLNG